MKAEASAVLFDTILSALGPLKSVPLQGTVANPDKNKSRHIGQLRKAFQDGTNKVQSKIFNDLLLVSENPLPQFSTEHSQEKVYPDQEPFQQKEDIKLRTGSSPSAPDPPVGQQEKVEPKQSDSEPVSTDSSMFCTLYIHLFPGIKSQRLWCNRWSSSPQWRRHSFFTWCKRPGLPIQPAKFRWRWLISFSLQHSCRHISSLHHQPWRIDAWPTEANPQPLQTITADYQYESNEESH